MIALLVALVVIVVAVLINGASRTDALRRYAETRAAYAPDTIEVLGEMDPALRESSGLAVSTRYGGVIWSHNDSGDEATVYALDSGGAVVARFDLEGVEARDWEAMDRGPCVRDPEATCLYLADTGDNVRRRDVLVVHLVPEPDPSTGGGLVETEGALRYLYPEGPLDAEAVAVAPDGTVVVVNKGRDPQIRLFSIDPERVRSSVLDDTAVRLDAGTPLPIEPDWDVGRVVTGAAFHPDGSALAVRTLTEIYFFSWPDLAPVGSPCFLGRTEPQGEAIAWESDGAILLSSETNGRGPGRLLRVRCSVNRP